LEKRMRKRAALWREQGSEETTPPVIALIVPAAGKTSVGWGVGVRV
jgi:hypothetical protein